MITYHALALEAHAAHLIAADARIATQKPPSCSR
jgi:hypothetical protein